MREFKKVCRERESCVLKEITSIVGLYIDNEFSEMEPRDSETSSNFSFLSFSVSKSDRTAHVIFIVEPNLQRYPSCEP